jgi:hypothetical protein
MGRLRPSHVKYLGQHRVASFRLDQARLVARMCAGLGTCHEAGAHDHSHRATGKRSSRRGRIADPARGKQRQRYGASHFGQPRQQTDDALYMAAGFRTCPISASAPAAAAARAASAEPICTSTRAPPARARAIRCGRSPKENDTTGAPSSTATSSRSSCSKSSTRFTQYGRSVTRAIERIFSRRTSGSVHDAPRPMTDASPASSRQCPAVSESPALIHLQRIDLWAVEPV